MYQDIGAITEADAHAEKDRLFDEPDELPAALVERGWKPITRAPGRMFAVSDAWGCTSTKGNVNEVVAEAWGLVGFIEYVKRRRVEDEPF